MSSTGNWADDYFERGYAQRWALNAPSPTTERECDALWDLLKLAPDTRVLDVGCGHGRYALALARRGLPVTGLDFATALLARAREIAATMNASADWIRGNMRALPLRDHSMQAALLFDAFGFFDEDDDNLLVLRELARVLVPGGRLAIKLVNATPIVDDFRAADREDRNDSTVEIHRSLLADPPRLVEDIVIHHTGGSGRYQRRQRLYRIDDVSASMQATGFEIASVFDGLGTGAFQADRSRTMLVTGERRRST